MKKLVIIIIAFSLCTTQKSFAQGIHFKDYQNWKELVARAKKEHKLIFLDGYTSWCGWCTYMQQNVFTKPSVGLYYNKTFINAKMDLEKNSEGPDLAEKFKVTAYPTFCFINGDGELVYKFEGACEGKELIALGHDALIAETKANKEQITASQK